jgi:hypothetical protein
MRKTFLRSLIVGLFALSAAGCTGGGSIGAPRLGPPLAPTHLYVADAVTPGHIYIYNLPLAAAAVPTGTITVATAPYSMRSDTSGRLFVGSNSATTLAVFAAPVTSASVPAFTLDTTHSAASYPAFDPAGNLFVGNDTTATCCITGFNAPITAASTPAFTMINHGGVNDLASPYGIAFDASGRLYVSSANSILMYTPPLSAATIPTATVLPNNDNYGIAVGPTNQLYVENATVDGTIDVFTTPLTNASVRSFGIAVTGSANPLPDIAVDPAGNLYATSFDGHVYFIPAPITAASVPTAALTFAPPTSPVGITVGP